MVFEIRRYHILILVLLPSLLIGGWIYSRAGVRGSGFGVRPVILRAEVAAGDRSREAAISSVANLPLPISTPKKISPPLQLLPLPLPPLPKTIAFTFDDGPHPQYTERLLKILRDRKIHATFFVVGKQVEKYPELVRLIFQDGHEIANHTYSHRDMRTLSPQEIGQELEKTGTLVRSITDQKMKYFRPPGGQYNPAVVQSAKAMGYEMILWSVFPQDHANPAAKLIRGRVLKSAQDRGIILFHSGIENTLEILPEIILALEKKGYSFVTVSQLESHQDSFPKLAHGKS